jgi:hypothetical protein
MDDWTDTDVSRLAAEQACITGFGKAKGVHDDNTPRAFSGLRKELAQWDEYRAQDLCALTAQMILGEENGYKDEDMSMRTRTRTSVRMSVSVRVQMQVRPSTFQSAHQANKAPRPNQFQLSRSTRQPTAPLLPHLLRESIRRLSILGKEAPTICTHSLGRWARAPVPALLAQAYWI